MFKKIILVILLLLLLWPAVFLIRRYIAYSGDKSPRKTFLVPEIRRVHLNIKDFKADRILLQGEVMLFNHLPIDLKADSLSYRLFMEDVEIMHSMHREKVRIPAADSAVLSLPVHIRKKQLDSIGGILKKKGDTAEYVLLLEGYSPQWFHKRWHYKTKWSGAAFHLLDTKYEKFKISKLKRKGTKFQVYLSFENENSFPIKVKDIKYVIYIDKDELTHGSRKGVLEFPAKKTTHVDFPAEISYRDMMKMLRASLPGDSKLRYKFYFSFTL
jgi:LEA14-like dessication related protein